jgi:PadR family transcriptional regulator
MAGRYALTMTYSVGEMRVTGTQRSLATWLYVDRVWRMPGRTAFSAQTLAVLAALAARPADWRHGYDLARETGLKSGTLYPILVRLADREIVQARWEEGEPAGRPRRHLYRLTSDGLAAATAALAAAPAPAARPARPGRATAPRRLALEGP